MPPVASIASVAPACTYAARSAGVVVVVMFAAGPYVQPSGTHSTGLQDALSIIAFDNLHSFLPLPFPLTSVSASKFSLAQRSVEILLRQIDNPHVPLVHLTLDVELIDRGTVRDLTGSSGKPSSRSRPIR